MKHGEELIIYIEYQDGKEHSVITTKDEKFYMKHYDFEVDCNDEKLMMYYNSGGGGSAKKGIYPPHYLEGYNGASYWIHPKARFIGIEKNIKKIRKPIRNPFEGAREVFSTIYCKFCDKILDEDWCEHIESRDGNIYYFTGEYHDS